MKPQCATIQVGAAEKCTVDCYYTEQAYVTTFNSAIETYRVISFKWLLRITNKMALTLRVRGKALC